MLVQPLDPWLSILPLLLTGTSVFPLLQHLDLYLRETSLFFLDCGPDVENICTDTELLMLADEPGSVLIPSPNGLESDHTLRTSGEMNQSQDAKRK